MILVIDRRQWFRGSRASTSQLILNDDRKAFNGKMCCLGFHGRKCRIPKKYLIGLATPAATARELTRHGKTIPPKFKALLSGFAHVDFYNNDIGDELMSVNDNTRIRGAKREAQLRVLFAKIGVKVRFTH